MVFHPPSWSGENPPLIDDVPICDFILDEKYGRPRLEDSKPPFICGITKKTYSAEEVVTRVDLLSRTLMNELGWAPNEGSEWDKVLAIFSLNSIDSIPISWAVHRLGGIVSLANAAYSVGELVHQLVDSKAKSLFTCLPLLPIALKAAQKVGLSANRIYLIELPEQVAGKPNSNEHRSVDQLIREGMHLPSPEQLRWEKGEGTRRTAFLCYSSGTSGLPKGVMISHKNVITNCLQITEYEKDWRQSLNLRGAQTVYTDVALGLLPQSHIYGLLVISHVGTYRGDQTVVLPKFDFSTYLNSIQNFKISTLYLVPPLIINMIRNRDVCSKYDLSSVSSVFTGAAPLGKETALELQKQYPGILIRQSYGLTETCTVTCSSHPRDIFLGSSGCLLPGFEVKLVSTDGLEITAYDTPGELYVRSPTIALGYLGNESATKETFQDGWMRTGDEALVRLSPKYNEHIFIVDRIKELIKVKGLQVAPAELEAHILGHSAVVDCAVIGVPDDVAGEVPKAFVVRSAAVRCDEAATAQSITEYVETHKARHKWLKGGIEFLDTISKSPSGKILRRLLRDQEKEARRRAGNRL